MDVVTKQAATYDISLRQPCRGTASNAGERLGAPLVTNVRSCRLPQFSPMALSGR
jgi:hypothetical protein